MQSYNPPAARRRSLGFSLFARHYSGNHCYFLFLSLLRCFSSGGWLPPFDGWHTFSVPGCPIRKSADIMLVCSSPQLIAAYHVLLRLTEPRHPPYALICFKRVCRYSSFTNFNTTNWFSLSQYVKELYSNAKCNWKKLMFGVRIQQAMCQHQILIRTFCGGYRSRTDDPLRARQML